MQPGQWPGVSGKGVRDHPDAEILVLIVVLIGVDQHTAHLGGELAVHMVNQALPLKGDERLVRVGAERFHAPAFPAGENQAGNAVAFGRGHARRVAPGRVKRSPPVNNR